MLVAYFIFGLSLPTNPTKTVLCHSDYLLKCLIFNLLKLHLVFIFYFFNKIFLHYCFDLPGLSSLGEKLPSLPVFATVWVLKGSPEIGKGLHCFSFSKREISSRQAASIWLSLTLGGAANYCSI